MRTVSLSPSDFAYMADKCPRCFWRKTRGVNPIQEAPNAIFKIIDGAMRRGVTVEHLWLLGIPAKANLTVEKVLSQPIPFPQHGIQFVIAGKLDRAFELDNGTFGIIDFKSIRPNPDYMAKFDRQLHAYAVAMESPAVGDPREITLLGLTCLDFSEAVFKTNGRAAAIQGRLCHVPVEMDRGKFHAYLEWLAPMIASPEMPDAGQGCQTCAALWEVRRHEQTIESRKVAS